MSGEERGRRRRGTTIPPQGPGTRIAKLEAEIAAARTILCEVVERLGGQPSAGDGEPSLVAIAERLDRLIAAHTQELREQSEAAEAANHELRSLSKNLDQIVRQRTRALAESESQLRRKNVELDRLNRMKEQFISIAAHELRTPMTSIVGYLDLFSERWTDAEAAGPDARRQLESLRRNAHRLKRLIEDMLDVSRIETGSISLRREPCSLAEIVLGAVDELRPLAEENLQKLETHIHTIAAIDADGDKVHQVVSNLVANALKYTPENGRVRVTVDATPGEGASSWARLRVWDDGPGIPAALRSRIFEPFSEVTPAVHHTSENPDPAGLGLRIAQGIVELHGGVIRVDSEEGRYTEFTVLLPFTELSPSSAP
jgi:signal transduction histidine kinase